MIKGFDKLQRDLALAQEALQELDGDLCSVKFDPYDPASIEQAIQHVVDVIESRVGAYGANPIVGPIIENMKEHYRQRIIEQAAEARISGGKNEFS